MLANQLARRGVRLMINRTAIPVRRSRRGPSACRPVRSKSIRKMGIVDQALALGMRTAGANMWGERAMDRAHPGW